MLRHCLPALVLLGALLCPAPAHAASPVVVGNTNWYEFRWLFSTVYGCPPGSCIPSDADNSQGADAPPWTFDGPAVLVVTDAFGSFNQFEVLDFGTSIGFTSDHGADWVDCGNDPVVCLANPAVSHGVFVLPAGAHSLTIRETTGDIAGAAYFRLDSPVIPVALDIRPGSGRNQIEPVSAARVAIALLSGASFDAASIDPTTLTFGRTGDEATLAFCDEVLRDVSGDGLPDLVCHFDVAQSGFPPGSSVGVLKGETTSGQQIRGQATFCSRDCR